MMNMNGVIKSDTYDPLHDPCKRVAESYERCARDAPAGEGYAAHMCTCADEYYGVCAHDGYVPCSLRKKMEEEERYVPELPTAE